MVAPVCLRTRVCVVLFRVSSSVFSFRYRFYFWLVLTRSPGWLVLVHVQISNNWLLLLQN